MSKHTYFVAFLFAAWSIAAAEVRLGPELPISPGPTPGVDPAALTQSEPKIASNGRGFLAIWEDHREGLFGGIYATPLDAEGRPRLLFGRRIGTGRTPVLAPDAAGSGYVIAWIGNGGMKLRRVDDDANTIEDIPFGNPVSALICDYGSPSGLLALHTNGTTYVLRATTYCYGFYEETILFKPNVGWRVIDSGGGLQSIRTVGGSYALIQMNWYYENDRIAVERKVFGDAGQVSTKVVAAFAKGTLWAMGGGEDRILAVQRENAQAREFKYLLIGNDGSVIKPATPISIPENATPSNVFWDGREFLLVLRSSASLSAIAIAADGTLLNAQPSVFSTTAIDAPAFAWNGAARAMLWNDRRFSGYGDVVSRSLADLRSLGDSEAMNLVSIAGRAQVGVQLAIAGSHRMAVWSDGLPRQISANLDGVSFDVASSPGGVIGLPSVIAGNDSFLVAWNDRPAGASAGRLLARRYAFDGTPLDAEPVVLATDIEFPPVDYLFTPFTGELGDRPGLASEGSAYLVVTRQNANDIRIVRVDAASGLFQSVAHRMSAPAGVAGTGVRATRGGDHWLLSFVRSNQTGCCSYSFSFITLPASLATTREIQPETVAVGSVPLFSTAAGSGRISYAFGAYGLTFRQMTATAVALPGKTDLSNSLARVALEWNGSEYLLAWTESLFAESYLHEESRLLGMRFAPDGHPLDAQPFEIVSSDVAGAFEPSIAVTGDGFVIAYSKAESAYGNVPRAYSRTLRRLLQNPSIPRRQSVRH